jgi:hypothetical protein
MLGATQIVISVSVNSMIALSAGSIAVLWRGVRLGPSPNAGLWRLFWVVLPREWRPNRDDKTWTHARGRIAPGRRIASQFGTGLWPTLANGSQSPLVAKYAALNERINHGAGSHEPVKQQQGRAIAREFAGNPFDARYSPGLVGIVDMANSLRERVAILPHRRHARGLFSLTASGRGHPSPRPSPAT